MKVRRFFLLFFCFFLFLAVSRTAPAFAQSPERFRIPGEHIEDFVARYAIGEDGTFTVTEAIVYDFGLEARHGIYRDIPYVKTNTEGKKFAMDLTIVSVTDETGKKYQYKKTDEEGTIRLRIGDPDRTIMGVHTYVIIYKVSGGLTYFSDHDELYWNVTGNDWNVPIAHVLATVTLPQNIAADSLAGACYTGRVGSTATDCAVDIKNGTVTMEETGYQPAYSGLTLAVSFPKGIVQVVEPEPVIDFADTWYGKIITLLSTIGFFVLLLGWYLLLPVWIGWQWLKSGRDVKSVKPLTAWYDPPKVAGRPLTASETGTLLDEKVDFDDISAMVVQLAQKGYLKIVEKSKKEFYLVKTKDYEMSASLMPFEFEFLSSAFAKGDELHLKQAKLYSELQKVEDMIYEQTVKDGLFPENPKKIRALYTVLGGLGMATLNVPLFVSALLFGLNLPRRTEAGSEALGVAKSLKNFLTSQTRQIKFQGKEKLLFEKLLPYAIAFRVEEEWAKRFADLKLPPPEWYESYGTYRSGMFVSNLHSSMSSLRSASSPPPSSTRSSSGFSSGSSGGSSGGGGGGGGGGSW